MEVGARPGGGRLVTATALFSIGHCRSPSPVFSSVRYGSRHILDCRCLALGNLLLDLNLAARRRATLVAA
eukprot:1877152-Pleurochrysis_carterae.AAC.5